MLGAAPALAQISTFDAPHPPPLPAPEPTLAGPEIWDSNHDGIYTCDEWKAYLDRMFVLADRNRDGSLDKSEFPVIRRAAPIFKDADFDYFDDNADGKITRKEFVERPSAFIMQHDRNGDCRVTPDEMKPAEAAPQSPRGKGKMR